MDIYLLAHRGAQKIAQRERRLCEAKLGVEHHLANQAEAYCRAKIYHRANVDSMNENWALNIIFLIEPKHVVEPRDIKMQTPDHVGRR